METQPAQPQAPHAATLQCRVPILSYDPQAGPTPRFDKLYTPQIRKTLSSYDQCRVERKRKFLRAHQWGATVREEAHTHPHPPSLDVGHCCLTKHPQIVSETGPHEANETQNSYETLRRSYKRCLTQHPNRIWQRHFAETPMRRLVSTAPPNPALHGYTPTPTMTQPRPMCYIDGY